MACELLTESGSCFVQIGDENVRLVRSRMDEVSGPENFLTRSPSPRPRAPRATTLPTCRITCSGPERIGSKPNSASRWCPRSRASGWVSIANLSCPTEAVSLVQIRRRRLGGFCRFDNLTSQSIGRTKGEGAASWFTWRWQAGRDPRSDRRRDQEHADFETLYDRPYEDEGAVRVAGPFTVESLQPTPQLVLRRGTEHTAFERGPSGRARSSPTHRNSRPPSLRTSPRPAPRTVSRGSGSSSSRSSPTPGPTSRRWRPNGCGRATAAGS